MKGGGIHQAIKEWGEVKRAGVEVTPQNLRMNPIWGRSDDKDNNYNNTSKRKAQGIQGDLGDDGGEHRIYKIGDVGYHQQKDSATRKGG